jgi:hypothetical protein
MPSQATQQLIDQAFADMQTAKGAEDAASKADQTVTQDQAAALAAHQAATSAHQKQATSSWAALSAMAGELNYPLPSPGGSGTGSTSAAQGLGGTSPLTPSAPSPAPSSGMPSFRGAEQQFNMGGAGAAILKWLPVLERILEDIRAAQAGG